MITPLSFVSCNGAGRVNFGARHLRNAFGTLRRGDLERMLCPARSGSDVRESGVKKPIDIVGYAQFSGAAERLFGASQRQSVAYFLHRSSPEGLLYV